MIDLFTPYKMKSLEVKNRIVMPPMCQYSVENRDGVATEWHYTHYLSRAIGGTGLIIVEMTDVEPDGRISDYDLGLWNDEQIEPLKKIVDACHKYGTKMAIQIGHAGRKAEDAKIPVAPSSIAFNEKYKTPRALTTGEVKELVEKFRVSVRRAVKAGFDAIEIHGAHGYIIHQFHSPLTNKRSDEYGEDLTKFGVEVIKAAKEEMPKDMPLIMRVSGREYVEGGYDINYGIEISKAYQKAGADIFHISAVGEGQIAASGRPGTHAAYQLTLARDIKYALNTDVIAVGRLNEPELANAIIGNEEVDLVAIGRGMFRNPYWALEAARILKKKTEVPIQYKYAFPEDVQKR